MQVLLHLYFLTLTVCTTLAQEFHYGLNDSFYPTYAQLTGNDVRLIPDYICRERPQYAIGRIEVKLEGKWGTICRNRLSLDEESVLCRQLGHGAPLRYHQFCARGDRDMPMWISSLSCNGDESHFRQCVYSSEKKSFCQSWDGSFHARDAGLACRKRIHPRPYDLPVSLHLPQIQDESFEPISPCSGVVQVSYNGVDGYISKLGVSDITGTVICEQLGFYKYLGPLPDQYVEAINESLPIILAKPNCSGSEARLVNCPHWGWGPFDHLAQYGPYSVQCTCEPQFECGEPESNTIRLRGKGVPWKGRLEVKIDGRWGPVCSYGFNAVSAAVACRQLGFKGSGYHRTRDVYSGNIGEFKMRNVQCQGNEEKLSDCEHHKISPPDLYCSNVFDNIVLYCEVVTPEPQVRLIAPTVKRDDYFRGRCKLLEYKLGDDWYPHCCEDGNVGIDYSLATVCRETGLGYITKSGCTDARRDIVSSIHGTFSCDKGACFTDSCKQGEWNVSDSCPSNRYTYVCCSPRAPDLVPSLDALKNSLGGIRRSRTIPGIRTASVRCAWEEGCLAPDAKPNSYYDVRRLLRFSTQSENIGSDIFRPPISSDHWQYHTCHKHYHSIEHFVDYSLVSEYGNVEVGHGHKASFCLEDTYCNVGGYPSRYCGRDRHGAQGISPNCYDLYGSHLDCQWIDVTRTAPGFYYLVLDMNPARRVPESDFSNNVVRCKIYFGGHYFRVLSCEYVTVSTPGHS